MTQAMAIYPQQATQRSASIARLSPKHHEIMRFICAHPTIRRGAVARHFQVTEAWLSTITNSDCFQDELRRNQMECTSDLFMSIGEKLEAVAIQGIERMSVMLEVEPDLDVVRKSTDSALKALGYSQPHPVQPGAAFQQNNFYVVDRDTLNRAQTRIGRTIEHLPEDAHEQGENGPTSQFPASFAGDGGQVDIPDTSARVEAQEAQKGPPGSGGELREESASAFPDSFWG